MTRSGALAVAWLAWAAVALASANDIRVTPVVDNGRVFATLGAAAAITPDLQDIVRSGLLLTLDYAIELRRPSSFWFDRTIGRSTVGATAKFDPLTGKYHVDRLQDGKIMSSKVSEQESEMRTLLTEFEKVPVVLAEPLEPNGDYYLHVRLRASPRTSFSLWSFWPWADDGPSGRATFTYLR